MAKPVDFQENNSFNILKSMRLQITVLRTSVTWQSRWDTNHNGRYKIYNQTSEVRLSQAAFNDTFLKNLEEPPPFYQNLFFATTERVQDHSHHTWVDAKFMISEELLSKILYQLK